MKATRREFLTRGACAAAGASAAARALSTLGRAASLAQGSADYRALVCVFLDGGNDGNNTVVPFDEYNAAGGYAAVRGSSGLAVPKAELLPVSPPSQRGLAYGLHPSLPELQTLFQQRRLAVLCNAGSLVEPLTRALYRAGRGHPYQLFSHSDQVDQQQTALADGPGRTGWGGRVSDIMTALNGASPMPLAVSCSGSALFASGTTTRQLVVNPEVRLNEMFRVDYGTDTPFGTIGARRAAFELVRADAAQMRLTRAAAEVTGQAMRAGDLISTDPTLPPLQPGQTDFPDSALGRQLSHVAKLVSLRAAFGVRRQIFFCSLGGFDHHSSQHNPFNGQDVLLRQVSLALKAFYDATVRLGVATQVTTFTLSDFGRTLEPSGSGGGVGSDHAWGNHHFIIGDAVRGGDFYGTYPTLALSGPDDADDRGRWIPTTSTDQYASTLALWLGLAPTDLPTVFPLLSRFASPDLGFML